MSGGDVGGTIDDPGPTTPMTSSPSSPPPSDRPLPAQPSAAEPSCGQGRLEPLVYDLTMFDVVDPGQDTSRPGGERSGKAAAEESARDVAPGSPGPTRRRPASWLRRGSGDGAAPTARRGAGATGPPARWSTGWLTSGWAGTSSWAGRTAAALSRRWPGVGRRPVVVVGLGTALAVVATAALTGLLPLTDLGSDAADGPDRAGGLATDAGTDTDPAPSVTLYLPAPDPDGLRGLAAATGLTDAQRSRRLADLLPSQQARDEVADRLDTLGFVVTATSTWSVTATAAAAHVTAIFGSASETRPELGVGQPLPGLPPSLRDLVSVVVGGDERRPALRALAVPRGSAAAPPAVAPSAAATSPPPSPAGTAVGIPADVGLTDDQVRSAYGVARPPAGADPTGPPQRVAVASLQLSGGDPADLSAYARAAGMPDPTADGRFTAIGVGRAATRDPARDGDGDRQFALDTQALLATAPGLAQRVYVAPNTARGLLEALDRVRADGPGRPDGPGDDVVALSVSWGECEQRLARPFVDTVETQLTALAAAGVTVFAGSGDGGSDGCGDGGQATVYPASSPSVVAVGGTTLLDPAGTVRETAWPGSGGGCSALFPPPSWQPESPCGTGRAVPDLALVGDPATGLAVHAQRHWKQGSGSATPGWVQLGGTGLATPLAAGLFAASGPGAAAGGAAGSAVGTVPAGWGDVHVRLAAAPERAFRDVTEGSNGGYQARAKHDLVTGRGAPLWQTVGATLAPPPVATPPAGPTPSVRAPTPTPGAVPPDLAAAGLGLDGGVWLLRGGSASFTPLGGSGTSAPTLVVHRGRLLVVVSGADRSLWIRDTARGGWGLLGPPGTHCFGQAAVVVGDDLHVGCRGGDRGLYVGTAMLPTSGDGLPARIRSWSRLGGETDHAPAVAVVDGTVTWFVTGRDAAPRDNLYQHGRDGWQRLPARCAGPPGAGHSDRPSGGDGGGRGATVYVGCRDAAGGLLYTTAGFTSFGGAGGTFTGGPSFAVDAEGGATVVVTGTDSALYHRRLDPAEPGELGWAKLGGRFLNGVSAVIAP